MKLCISNIFIFLLIINVSCNRIDKIKTLLTSNDKEDIITGAFKAGKSGKRELVPLLLQNADDPRLSTDLRHKGISVYQAKMMALSKIFKRDPHIELSRNTDSSIIKFYTKLAEEK